MTYHHDHATNLNTDATTLAIREPLQCCTPTNPWSAFDPNHLGYKLATATRTAVNFLHEDNGEPPNEQTPRLILAHAIDTITLVMDKIDGLDDHDLRHVIEGIHASTRNGIEAAKTDYTSDDRRPCRHGCAQINRPPATTNSIRVQWRKTLDRFEAPGE
jgi:hypothetical protein